MVKLEKMENVWLVDKSSVVIQNSCYKIDIYRDIRSLYVMLCEKIIRNLLLRLYLINSNFLYSLNKFNEEVLYIFTNNLKYNNQHFLSMQTANINYKI